MLHEKIREETMEETVEYGMEAGAGEPAGRFSDILVALAIDESRDRISIGDLFSKLGDRAFGALMLVFALPNVVPSPPGTSAVTGTPLVFLAAQLMLGRSPWLPKLIANRSLMRSDFAVVVNRVIPWLARAEGLLRPRLTAVARPPVDYLTGFVCLVLAVVLALPIPLANILPAIAICLFSFALLEKDGLFALGGFAMAAVSMLVAGGVILAFFKAAVFLIEGAFG